MATNKQERQQACVLWKKTSKAGKTYFTGILSKDGKDVYVTAFYQLEKKNPEQPDLRIYEQDEKGSIKEKSILDLWCNVSKAKNKKYLSGKLAGKRVVGFVLDEKAGSKRPYISIYWSEEQAKKETPAKQEAPALNLETEDLPF